MVSHLRAIVTTARLFQGFAASFGGISALIRPRYLELIGRSLLTQSEPGDCLAHYATRMPPLGTTCRPQRASRPQACTAMWQMRIEALTCTGWQARRQLREKGSSQRTWKDQL